MASAREKKSGGKAIVKSGSVAARAGSVARWVVVPCVGVGFALWSAATVAGVYSTAASISVAPHLSALNAPGRIMVAEPRHPSAEELRAKAQTLAARERQLRFQLASNVAQEDKTARVTANTSPRLAALVPGHDAAANKAGATLPPPVSLEARIAAADLNARMPDPSRFGPKAAEPERSSRLALALAGAARSQTEYAVPLPEPDTASRSILLASLELTLPDDSDPGQADSGQIDAGQDDTEAPAFAMPDSAPLPVYRPRLERQTQREEQPAQQERPPRQEVFPAAPRLAKKPAPAQTMMAYARPDNPERGGIAQAFKNLFSGQPGAKAGGGVAVYDISAATVYMPDGQRLEAHSGLGHMVDNVRYVDQKMRGPTPPNTYNLTIRESRFHGVEAIRLTPVDGRNKFGRNGLLAHTYMLRGGRAESNGCVVFKDYDRFLKAFKRGKVRQLVVVPGGGRSRMSNAVAENGRGT
jgi:hypothetical protein